MRRYFVSRLTSCGKSVQSKLLNLICGGCLSFISHHKERRIKYTKAQTYLIWAATRIVAAMNCKSS